MNAPIDPQQFRLAAVQMVSTPDVKENLQTASRLIQQAAQAGAQLVLLPEYFCLMGLKDIDKIRVREKLGVGFMQDQLAQLAKEQQIYLVAGTIPLETNQAAKVNNTTLVFDPAGKMIARYDKIHLFSFQTADEHYDEANTLVAGVSPALLQINLDGVLWKMGLSICYDLRFPELYRALGEVDCHLVPAAFTYTTGKDHWEILLRARAIENQCYVLASAQGGTHLNRRRTWGNSMLVDPWGEIEQCLVAGEGFILGTLSKDKLNAVRSKLPALLHRKL
ncbi:carbon-nitrogen hydrolase family protein [Polynucleobacter sp. IMCC30063]|uniref:carbon-nitrogen hydrolase family protein n=1 Tax=unclassified Polynucleobacter TaxID=2640945 RepID=UPI001F1CDCAA|nr:MULTISPECIES: carbon-nitrogen hydrolase family protein [unclassified Polynucleobacter]MCE7506665.1 carbon-nitrogen hydrolase family protein [Polynucleobacter sp. IMCC30063]MCE7526643.1 carbon-nitrogen hydrolase family protein [Polynucleobacter sp. IMCC 30228]MCE7530278.1 carbon-nitrogen hydrolase family protein [Polynucleobacter sp. IMCC 29146]